MSVDTKLFLIFLILVFATNSALGVEGVTPEPREFPPDSEIKDEKIVTPDEIEPLFKEPFVDFLKNQSNPYNFYGQIGANHNLDLYATTKVNSDRGGLQFEGTRNAIKFEDWKVTGEGNYILPSYKNLSLGINSGFLYSKVNEVDLLEPAVGAFTSGLEGVYLTPKMFAKFNLNSRFGRFKNKWKSSDFFRVRGASQLGLYLDNDKTINLNIKGEKATYSSLVNRVLGAGVSFLKTNLGFKFDVGLNINKSYQKLIGAPFVKVSAQTERSRLYGEYRRTLITNNYASFSDLNPIYELNSSQFPAREVHDALLGGRFNLPSHLWTGIALNFKRQRSLLTPYLDEGLIKSRLKNVNHLNISFKFSYSQYNQLIFDYDYIRSFDGKVIPFQRNLKITDTLRITPLKGLNLKLWGQYLGDEYVSSSQELDTLDSYVTGGFEVNYTWRELVFFGKGLNILNRKHEYFPGKFAEGSKGIVGVRYTR